MRPGHSKPQETATARLDLAAHGHGRKTVNVRERRRSISVEYGVGHSGRASAAGSRRGWMLHYALSLAIVAVAVFVTTLPVGKILSYRNDAHRARAEAERLRSEARALRERARMESTRPALERQARESLGMALPEELVFVPVAGDWPAAGSSVRNSGGNRPKVSPKSDTLGARGADAGSGRDSTRVRTSPRPSPSPSTTATTTTRRGEVPTLPSASTRP